MNKNTSRLLIYAIIFLTVLNIATFISIGINVRNAKKDLPKASSAAIQAAQNFNGRYFRDKLNLSADQMDSFRIVNEKFRSNARRINTELNILRANMMESMKQTPSDTIKLSLQSDSIGILHADLKKLTYEYYLGIKNICSDQQVLELNNIFEQFFINSGQHQGHGEGNQGQGFRGKGNQDQPQGQGRGFGRRKNE